MEKSTFSEDYGTILRALREQRRASDLTQVQVAARLGWTQTQVSKAERGERRLDLVELRSWCHALGVTLPYFVERLEPRLSRPPKHAIARGS